MRPIAGLIVPSPGIDQIVPEGARGLTLAFRPGQLESYTPASEDRTMILTGHRDTHFLFFEKFRQARQSRYKLEQDCGIVLRCEIVRSLIHGRPQFLHTKTKYHSSSSPASRSMPSHREDHYVIYMVIAEMVVRKAGSP
jgi:hypothetical protein